MKGIVRDIQVTKAFIDKKVSRELNKQNTTENILIEVCELDIPGGLFNDLGHVLAELQEKYEPKYLVLDYIPDNKKIVEVDPFSDARREYSIYEVQVDTNIYIEHKKINLFYNQSKSELVWHKPDGTQSEPFKLGRGVNRSIIECLLDGRKVIAKDFENNGNKYKSKRVYKGVKDIKDGITKYFKGLNGEDIIQNSGSKNMPGYFLAENVSLLKIK